MPTEYIDKDDVQLCDDVLGGGEEEGHQQQDRVGCHLMGLSGASGQRVASLHRVTSLQSVSNSWSVQCLEGVKV